MYKHCNICLQEILFSKAADRRNQFPNLRHFAILVLYTSFIKCTAILIFRQPYDNNTYKRFHKCQLPGRHTLWEMTLWTCSRSESRQTYERQDWQIEIVDILYKHFNIYLEYMYMELPFTLMGDFTLTPSIYLSQHPHPHPNVFLLRQSKFRYHLLITIWVLHLITIWAGWNY